jgi:hypothetical protein
MLTRIDYLADHLEVVSLLARWHHYEWADLLPGWSGRIVASDLLGLRCAVSIVIVPMLAGHDAAP